MKKLTMIILIFGGLKTLLEQREKRSLKNTAGGAPSN